MNSRFGHYLPEWVMQPIRNLGYPHTHFPQGRKHTSFWLALVIAFCWSSLLFNTIYPYPSRWLNDDMIYLNVAKHIEYDGAPYRTAVFFDSDLDDMRKLGQADPLYQHVLDIHVPVYSYFLSPFLLMAPGNFWAVYLAHTLLLLGIAGLTYHMATIVTPSKKVAFLASVGVIFSPAISMYTAITMREIFLVFLAMSCIRLALLPSGIKNNLYKVVALAILVLSRVDFLLLAGCICLVHLIKFFKFPQRTALHFVTILLMVVVPLLVSLTIGRMGVLWNYTHDPTPIFSLMSPSSKDLYTLYHAILSNFLVNWSYVALPHEWIGEPISQLYIYITLAVLLCAGYIFRNDLSWIVWPAYFGSAVIILAMGVWWRWCAVRYLMWGLPFGYIFMFALLDKITPQFLKTILIVLLVALLSYSSFRANSYLYQIQIQERASMQNVDALSQQVETYIASRYPAADFVIVPSSALYYLTLLDVKRAVRAEGNPDKISSLLVNNHIGTDIIFIPSLKMAEFLKSPLMADHIVAPDVLQFKDGSYSFELGVIVNNQLVPISARENNAEKHLH